MSYRIHRITHTRRDDNGCITHLVTHEPTHRIFDVAEAHDLIDAGELFYARLDVDGEPCARAEIISEVIDGESVLHTGSVNYLTKLPVEIGEHLPMS